VELLRHPGSDQEPVQPDADGWWRIGGDAWRWSVVDDPLAPGGVDAEMFQSWGPGDDQVRCTTCHAIDQIDYEEMPSIGFGIDTTTRCRRCGSSVATDPMFGAHHEPAPWPPSRDRQAELDLPTADGPQGQRS
jgi:hypothetical protein